MGEIRLLLRCPDRKQILSNGRTNEIIEVASFYHSNNERALRFRDTKALKLTGSLPAVVVAYACAQA